MAHEQERGSWAAVIWFCGAWLGVGGAIGVPREVAETWRAEATRHGDRARVVSDWTAPDYLPPVLDASRAGRVTV